MNENAVETDYSSRNSMSIFPMPGDGRTLASSTGASVLSVSEENRKRARMESYLSLLATNLHHPRMAKYPSLPSRPWYEAADFPVAVALEANFDQIRREVLGIERALFQREIESLRRDGSWDVFFLYERGLKLTENCALCPVTTKIIEEHQTLRGLGGAIYFSRVSPGTHIRPHRGITNMRVRCQFALQIPDGDCALRVATEVRQWQEGKAIVFDDNYQHEVWNHTNGDRIILIADLWHPDLSPYEVAMLEGLQRYAFQYARDLNAYWKTNERARAEALQQFA